MKLMLAQNTAQQRAAVRTEQQAQRRAAALHQLAELLCLSGNPVPYRGYQQVG